MWRKYHLFLAPLKKKISPRSHRHSRYVCAASLASPRTDILTHVHPYIAFHVLNLEMQQKNLLGEVGGSLLGCSQDLCL